MTHNTSMYSTQTVIFYVYCTYQTIKILGHSEQIHIYERIAGYVPQFSGFVANLQSSKLGSFEVFCLQN